MYCVWVSVQSQTHTLQIMQTFHPLHGRLVSPIHDPQTQGLPVSRAMEVEGARSHFFRNLFKAFS